MATTVVFKGVEVEITGLEGEVSEGAFCTEAFFVETGEPLTEQELDQLNDLCQSELYDAFYQNQVAAAEAYADSLQDR